MREPLEVPGLLDVQTESFEWLIGAPRWREIALARGDVNPVGGLEEVLAELSPIEDFSGSRSLSFSDPRFDEVKAPVDECKDKDMTYAAPLFVTAEFINNKTGEIKSQTVFMGDFPMMTAKGTFIINGTERVVVSQLVRSPGVYFDETIDKSTEKTLHSVKVIPGRGAWLEFDIDKRDTVGVRIDRKRRQPVTVLLKALGWTNERIVERFGFSAIMMGTLEKDNTAGTDEALLDIYRKLRPGDPPTKESAQTLLENLFFKEKRYDLARVGRYKVNKKLGLNTDKPITDSTLTKEDVVATIEYLVRLHEGQTTMTVPGGVEVPVETDDIDHFGNRRLRTVGELIQNQIRVGLSRMERVVRERMTTQDVEAITPQTLINIRPVVAAINEFFGTSQLSQFMDQNNPLSGLTHKRRLSALGPGGLSRERAGLEVRDVHSQPLRPDVPDRDAGRPEHRSDRLAVGVRAGEPVRLHRDPVPQGGRRCGQRRHRVPDRRRGGPPRRGAGQLADRRERPLHRGARAGAPQGRRGRVRLLDRGRSLHGRLAAPDGVGRDGHDPVPRARRRQPGPDGCQHAAPGGSAGAQRGPTGRHRHGAARRDRRGRCRRRRQGRRDRRGLRRLHHRDGRRRHPAQLPDAQVRPVQPRHLRQPASDRGRRAACRGGPGHRRRPVHRER